jgi:hypothetical protein
MHIVQKKLLTFLSKTANTFPAAKKADNIMRKYIGQACDYNLEYEDSEIRIWDDVSQITITGDCVTEDDKESIRKNIYTATIESTGDDDKDLTAAWAAIESIVREYFDSFDVEIAA